MQVSDDMRHCIKTYHLIINKNESSAEDILGMDSALAEAKVILMTPVREERMLEMAA